MRELRYLVDTSVVARVSPAVMNRAPDVMEAMAASGAHRGAKPLDFVIAAAAEPAGLAVLHYDDDCERIAEVTGQPSPGSHREARSTSDGEGPARRGGRRLLP